MLVEKKSYGANDVVAIKFTNGEEIIARVADLSPTEISLVKPIMVGLTPSPGGHPGQAYVGFMPFMIGLDENSIIKIEFSKIMAVGKAGADMQAKYIERTTDIKIATPEMKSKLKL
jgi:hypothetical protein